MISRRLSHLSICFLLALLLTACAAPPARPRVTWPAAPDKPRLEWIQNYYSQDDFPKSGFQLFLEGFLGKPPLTFFARPFGIAADVERDLVYISDPDTREVRVFDLRNYTIKPLNEVTPFGKPLGMTLDSKGNLYVCDAFNHTVLVFGPDHQQLFTVGSADTLNTPAYVKVNERLGRIYVSDGMASKVVAFDISGKKLFEFGELGSASGQFRGPQGIAIDAQDRVFVADLLNARIQVFDADGKFLYLFGERLDEVYGFESPKDLAFDSDGNLHILDFRKSGLLSYTAEGKMLLHTGGERATASPVGFALPTSIWIGKDDRIYISEAFNRRFSVWQYLSDAYLAKHPLK